MFDPLLIGSIICLLLLLLFIAIRVWRLNYDEQSARRRAQAILALANARQDGASALGGTRNEPIVIGGRSRAILRRRFDNNDGNEAAELLNQRTDISDEEIAEGSNRSREPLILSENVGTKKLAKLQAKAERKTQREAELVQREERKQREQEREKKRLEEEERRQKEEEDEKKRLGLEREERRRREEEEYQKMKAEFLVDDEGFDQLEDDQGTNLMRDFLKHIKDTKVVNMDELAACFNLKPTVIVERVKHFLDTGELTGVIDDRGKFIYITDEELQAVARFINQRGRVSIAELAQYSNKLIRLE